MASQLAKEIRDSKESGSHDLKGSLSEEQAGALVAAAFTEPFELSEMIKVTLVVGAGKLARQKYDDNLGKWVCLALTQLGFSEDRGAALSLDCAGTFKYQHDTGKNEKFVHVFPRVAAPAGEGGAEGAGAAGAVAEAGGAGAGPLSADWLCVVSKLDTFKQMVEAKMPAWLEKKRCAEHLVVQQERLQAAIGKLAAMAKLDEEEQRLMDQADGELLEQKVAFLHDAMKTMVEEGRLTKDEQQQVAAQMEARVAALKAEAAEHADKPKRHEKLVEAAQQLAAKRERVLELKPFAHELSEVKELRSVWRRLGPMDKLLEKAGPKGRWSNKLSPEEVAELGDKEELDAREAQLLGAARHWFEEKDIFDERVKVAKKTVIPLKTAPKPKPVGGSASGGGGGGFKPAPWAAKAPAGPVVDADGFTQISAPKKNNQLVGAGKPVQAKSNNPFAGLD
jgi:hypothetical protein